MMNRKHGKSKGHLSRRGFLVGTGAALALPWLEFTSGGVALAQGADFPKRFLAFFVPNGFNMNRFWPTQQGALTPASLQNTSLASLVPHAERLLVLNGLDNHAGSAQGDGPGDHARGTTTFLTCAHPRKHASDIRAGVSVDQVLAQHYDGATRFNSLEIGCEGGGNAGACDSGYSCAYVRNISWADAHTPLPKETNPRLLFNRLFGGLDPNASAATRERQLRRRTSVLDFVLADARNLNRQLGREDRRRMDAYMTSVRAIENRLEDTLGEDLICEPALEAPQRTPGDRGVYAGLMLDMMVEAMRCDLTRVGTFMFGNGGSNRAHTEIGIQQGHRYTRARHDSRFCAISLQFLNSVGKPGRFSVLLNECPYVN